MLIAILQEHRGGVGFIRLPSGIAQRIVAKPISVECRDLRVPMPYQEVALSAQEEYFGHGECVPR